MNGIFKCGLVAALLICGAMSVAIGDDEVTYSEDYKDGFYVAGSLLGTANGIGGSLFNLYQSLGGTSTPETVEIVGYYNNQSQMFNEQTVPYVNSIIFQIFGPDDNRTEDLYLGEFPYIE